MMRWWWGNKDDRDDGCDSIDDYDSMDECQSMVEWCDDSGVVMIQCWYNNSIMLITKSKNILYLAIIDLYSIIIISLALYDGDLF